MICDTEASGHNGRGSSAHMLVNFIISPHRRSMLNSRAEQYFGTCLEYARRQQGRHIAGAKRLRVDSQAAYRIAKEIIRSQRLRKEGKWKAAKSVLHDTSPALNRDVFFLNEAIRVRAAELCATRSSISATALYTELLAFSNVLHVKKNVSSFNAILLGLQDRASRSRQSCSEDLMMCAKVFDLMLESGVQPDHFTMCILFRMCGECQSLPYVRYFEQRASESLLVTENKACGTALLTAFARCGDMGNAEKTFASLRSIDIQLSERVFVSMMAGFSHCGQHRKVLEYFHMALQTNSVRPKVHLFTGVLASCCRVGDSRNAEAVFGEMKTRKIAPTDAIFVSLFETAVQSGDIALGSKLIFEWMPQHGFKKNSRMRLERLAASGKKSNSPKKTASDVKALVKRASIGEDWRPCLRLYNAVIATLCAHGYLSDAKQTIDRLPKLGLVPDAFTYNSLIHGCGVAKRPEEAVEVFRTMRKKGVPPNQVTYNTLKSALSGGRGTRETLWKEVSLEMESDLDLKMDAVTFSTELEKIRRQRNPSAAMDLYRRAIREGTPLDGTSYGSLLSLLFENQREGDALSILGWLIWKRMAGVEALNVTLEYIGKRRPSQCFLLFESMKRKGIAPNAITYTTLIHTCSLKGLMDRAFRLLGEMQDVGLGVADSHAWTAIIHGCGKNGQWERAVEVFELMRGAHTHARLVPAPTTASYNAALYAAGVQGGQWKVAKEIYQALLRDAEQKPDTITYSAMASCVLRNRFDIDDWDVVRDIFDNLQMRLQRKVDSGEEASLINPGHLKAWPRTGPSQKKLAVKASRMRWLLTQRMAGLHRANDVSNDAH